LFFDEFQDGLAVCRRHVAKIDQHFHFFPPSKGARTSATEWSYRRRRLIPLTTTSRAIRFPGRSTRAEVCGAKKWISAGQLCYVREPAKSVSAPLLRSQQQIQLDKLRCSGGIRVTYAASCNGTGRKSSQTTPRTRHTTRCDCMGRCRADNRHSDGSTPPNLTRCSAARTDYPGPCRAM
jgi:hypothetical protein